MAGCRGMDTALYITQACRELEYPVGDTRTVLVDNKAEVDWINGSVSNKRSRHIDVRYYRSRHLQEQGEVNVQYIPTFGEGFPEACGSDPRSWASSGTGYSRGI